MAPTILFLALATAAPATELQTELWQVTPGAAAKRWAAPAQPVTNTRAVVLIPGLHFHPLRPVKAVKPELRHWQHPKSELVKALSKDFDVFAFAYSQTVSLDDVAQSPGLRTFVAELRKAGYTEIVLVGHSAGGIIGRQFADQNPDAGVTKVIAVASPFAGAELATLNVGYPKAQAPFVKSLTPEARKAAVGANTFNKEIEFACVVCKVKRLESDGVVNLRSQWPEELQKLGVPAVLATVSHTEAMDEAESTKTIHALATGKLARWSDEEVTNARKVLFGETVTRNSFLRRQAK
ncbi:Alpha/beta hydrolase family protein [Gemmata obscuriglobus]|nr:alpha/beta fold hydrolase [Gemmata obscuriglobus]QEG29753.1 Alpha/beta hydrolase family protein [Gemmata obscuriglobus]VTS09070.1 : Abhydrolase_6 [Gemmata obscuriglobus UQM 2246]